MKTIISKSPRETLHAGAALAQGFRAGDIVCLFGDLGSGKTTFVKGAARAFGIPPQDVHSPTFVLLNIYEKGRLPLYHFDFYRLKEESEIPFIGYDEFLYGRGVALIEWAERLGHLMPREYLAVHFIFKNERERVIKISARGEKYRRFIKAAANVPGLSHGKRERDEVKENGKGVRDSR